MRTMRFRCEIPKECENCGKPARVIGVYGECTAMFCPECYVDTLEPARIIPKSYAVDLDGAWVGRGYKISEWVDEKPLHERFKRFPDEYSEN